MYKGLALSFIANKADSRAPGAAHHLLTAKYLLLCLFAGCCHCVCASAAPAPSVQRQTPSKGVRIMSLRNTIIAAASLAVLSLAPVALTQATPANTKSESALREKADKLVADALKVVQMMKAEPELWALVQQAKGIFIVPHYARAGLVVGGQGGQGVLVFNQDGKWGNPLFYNIDGVSLGAHASVEVGPKVMLLMHDKAASRAMTEYKFALIADAD